MCPDSDTDLADALSICIPLSVSVLFTDFSEKFRRALRTGFRCLATTTAASQTGTGVAVLFSVLLSDIFIYFLPVERGKNAFIF